MKYQIPTHLNKNNGIYLIANSIDDRFYVGSAVGFRRRYANHLSALKKGTHDNQRLQNFANKYGLDSLRFTLLSVCDKPELIAKEQFFINTLSPSFNICLKAGNTAGQKPWLGRKHSEEVKQRISKSNRLTKGQSLKPKPTRLSKAEALDRLVAYSKTDEARQARRDRMTGHQYWLGRQHTEETKTKMSANNGRTRSIIATDTFGSIIHFDTGKLAAQHLGVGTSAICNGIARSNKVKGYTLAYEDPNTL